ncbi:MAG: HsdR family type I site-specific deoxyribonuclease [Burkholderiales bacterium]|nr:HsdR family type I site-specific deoxyribonuclease [Burkholderiales bacterium]
MTPQTNETVIQKNTINLLKSMGWSYISRDDNIAVRDNRIQEVILKDILLAQLQKINSFEYKGVNYKFSPKNISRAVEELNIPLNEGLNPANQKISDKLILGTSYDEELNDGDRKSFSLRYIDFANPENNVFHCTEEYSVSRQIIIEAEKTRRPDIVLFINGIPIAVIELKKSSINAEQGISQMIRNQGVNEVPHLFKYIQITVAGNNFNPLYATTDTPAKFYSVWQEDNNHQLANFIFNRTISKLDQTIFSLFNKSRLLELLHSYIIFDKRVKKITRYQQYFAISNILKKIQTFTLDGSRAGGLIWHTPGSGKSLTMSILTKLLKSQIIGSRIIVVTDRKDLDSQIHTIFSNSEIQAGRASSGHDLIEKLQSGLTVVTTLIHKFETVKNEKIVMQDPNIFILVDESHRTQGGDLHKAMKKVFPRACYLGFTGTPLLKREKASIAKFGGLIHRYTIEQAVKDKAVLPLLYEGRLVDQWISDKEGLDRRFEIISRNLNYEQKEDLTQKWARFSRVASSERRLEMIALDINEHYSKNFQGTGFKAMLATSSKYEAIKYHDLFEKYGNIKTAFVISAADTREGYDEVDENNKLYVSKAWTKIINEYGNEENFLNSVKSKFLDEDEIELLIVVDKLLTGFDAPRAAVLYIDKELKEHSLLQAVARVNRLFEGKEYGFIIDYRGLLGNLDNALTSYGALANFDEQDLIGAVIDIKSEIAKIKTFYSHLQDLFKPVINKNDQESYQVFLADKELRKQFYDLLSAFSRALKLSLSSDKIDEILSVQQTENYKRWMKFYSELRLAIKIRYHEEVDFGKYEKEMQKLMDTFISANEVNQLTKLVNIFENEFNEELERVIGNNAKADTILNATARFIKENRQQNPNFYDKLSQKIEQIIQEYREGRLSDEDKLKYAKDIRNILMTKREDNDMQYPVEIQNNACARALFDNLYEIRDMLAINEFTKIVLQIDAIFKSVSKKPDWQYNNDVKNQIDQSIDDILYALEKQFHIQIEKPVELIAQLRLIGINNYAR